MLFAVMTPPKSPILEVEGGLSNSSSVEVVDEEGERADASDHGSTSHMTELVQERMASLGLRPVSGRWSLFSVCGGIWEKYTEVLC